MLMILLFPNTACVFVIYHFSYHPGLSSPSPFFPSKQPRYSLLSEKMAANCRDLLKMGSLFPVLSFKGPGPHRNGTDSQHRQEMSESKIYPPGCTKKNLQPRR
jgi:hypothetical protein